MAAKGPRGTEADIEYYSTALHVACQGQGSGKLFTQDEMISLGVIPDGSLELLTECLNALGNEGLLKLMVKDGKPCWKTVSKEDAAK